MSDLPLPGWLAAGGIGVRLTPHGPRYTADWLNDDTAEPDDDYAPDDPKSEGYHDRMADIYDLRDKTERMT